MIADVIRITQHRPQTLAAVCEKLVCSQDELVEAVQTAQKKGANVRIVDGYVTTKQKIGAVVEGLELGDTRPGRKMVPLVTDLHFGSAQCRHRDIVRFLVKAWKLLDKVGIPESERVVVCTGDVLDGNKPVLIPDQSHIGFDNQVRLAVSTFGKVPPFTYLSIDGNHDGYFSSAIGTTSGVLLAERMQEAGVNWLHLGQCEGRAKIHGANWFLHHGMGGASTRNAIRRLLNSKAENFQEHVDILALGHYHKAVVIPTFPERVYGVAGGCFQEKGSEFANRMNSLWDVGGTMVSYDLSARGVVSHISSEFYAVAGAHR